MNRQKTKDEEIRLLAQIYKKNPQLFQQETLIDNPNFLTKLGIFIKGKENLPVGYLKLWPQDFIVEEVSKDGEIQSIKSDNFFDKNKEFSEKDSTIYANLVKCGLSTIEAIEEISSFSGIDKKKIQFAGIKDKDAFTSQLISFRKIKLKEIQKIKSPYLFLKNIYSGKGAVEIGSLRGNEFTILVRTDNSFQKENFLKNMEEIKRSGFYNFFYLQRFGTPRLINFYWGLFILRGEYEKAVLSFLCSPGKREISYFKTIREGIKNSWGNWSEIEEILNYFPLIFQNEIKVINYLKNNPGDFSGALSQIPEQIQLWIFAYASLLFNKKISFYLKRGVKVPSKIPLILSKDEKDWLFYEDFLSEDKIFSIPLKYIKPFPNVQWKKREIKTKEKVEIHQVKIIPEGVILNFTLPKAAYATTFLSHLFNLTSGLPPKNISSSSVDTKLVLSKGSLEKVFNQFKDVISPKTENYLKKFA